MTDQSSNAENNRPPPPSFPNSFMLGSGPIGGRLLKKVNKKKAFCDCNILELLNGSRATSLNERMRSIDILRFHSPVEEECKMLHIPDDRINLLQLKDLLYLCGGGVGVRFTGEDLNSLKTISTTMGGVWAEVDRAYSLLTPAQKKIVVSDISIHDIQVGSSEESDVKSVVSLHELLDSYLKLAADLQSTVKGKQASIVVSEDNANNDGSLVPGRIDPDPESSIGKKIPPWISILIDKYVASLSVGSSARSAVTIGKLSVFLTDCVRGEVACSQPETDALIVLLQASNDQLVSYSDRELSTLSPQMLGKLRGMSSSSRRYWATRIFNFLSTVVELKSTVKDAKALEAVEN